ncbi:MAG: hypothetical protein F4W89_10425 [Acidobacteria bacterium]|nr:hypothetical protein [Acidobacteriota bacterium]
MTVRAGRRDVRAWWRAGAVAVVVSAALLATGCAAGRAFQQGGEAARAGQWDAAVEYYRRAVGDDPDRPEYRIALERAMLEASRAHAAEAVEREASGDLNGALHAWRRAYALDPSHGQAAVRIASLQQTLREQVEAARAPPPIEALREQARRQMQSPLLDPASDEPLSISFADASLRAIIDFLGEAGGINVTYDEGFEDATYSVTLRGLAFEEALTRILAANGAFHAVVNPTTIVVAPDTPAARAAYAPQVIRTFYVSHADVEELAGLLTAVVGGIDPSSPPQFFANTVANSITVRATAAVAAIVERVIAANDKPPAEIIIDVEILEVNRDRAKRYGLDLSQYSITTTFSPESAPGGATASDEAGDTAAGAFNLNTITRGVSFADFYTAVPAAVVNFLEQDSQTRLVAQPQLRGQEGTELSLNLGQEIPVPTTAFTPLAAGGASFNPLTSFQYRPVGVILNMTPRVTYENEIVLDLEVENSTVGPPISVAGQSLPTFGTRNVETRLRLRDGESNLLAGLLRQEERQLLKGFPGLLRLPILRRLFSANDESVRQTDIVILLTPRIVRAHNLTQDDVSPIHIGTQRDLGLTGPPPQIAAAPEAGAEEEDAAADGSADSPPADPDDPDASPPGEPAPPAR